MAYLTANDAVTLGLFRGRLAVIQRPRVQIIGVGDPPSSHRNPGQQLPSSTIRYQRCPIEAIRGYCRSDTDFHKTASECFISGTRLIPSPVNCQFVTPGTFGS